MRFFEIITEIKKSGIRNDTIENAINKFTHGYRNRPNLSQSCYDYAGYNFAKLPEEQKKGAMIRFWGLKHNNSVYHGDVLLKNGKIISDIPPETYTKKGYELVYEFPYFKENES